MQVGGSEIEIVFPEPADGAEPEAQEAEEPADDEEPPPKPSIEVGR